jgi:hypothetical protein
MRTIPLRIGAEGEGAAYFGVVLTFSPPLAVVGVDVLDGLEALELVEEPLEDPQPAASATAAQAISVHQASFIGAVTLA